MFEHRLLAVVNTETKFYTIRKTYETTSFIGEWAEKLWIMYLGMIKTQIYQTLFKLKLENLISIDEGSDINTEHIQPVCNTRRRSN